jgi:hypothetical protein
MADVGDIRATLSVDVRPWTQALQQTPQPPQT